MNIALTTIAVFIFLLPGIVFRKFYFSGVFSKEYFKQSFYELFLSTFLPAILLHIAWIYLVRLFSKEVDFILIGKLLIAKESALESFVNLQTFFNEILLYNTTIILAGGLLGYFFRIIIRWRKWDRKIKLFRFQNNWHYIFSGEIFDFPTSTDLTVDKVEDIALFYVDAMVETNEGTVIYDGILVDYILSKSGGLELIKLTDVQRRYLREDSPSKEFIEKLELNKEQLSRIKKLKKKKYYDLPGTILVIPYDRILNLNISYYVLEYDFDKKEHKVREVK